MSALFDLPGRLGPAGEGELGAAAVELLAGLLADRGVQERDDQATILALIAAQDADLQQPGGLQVTFKAPHLALDVGEHDIGAIQRDRDLIA